MTQLLNALFIILIITIHGHAKSPIIQPHNGTLFLSHGKLVGGLSWGHIIVDIDLNQVKEELDNHTKLLEVTGTAIQDGLKDTKLTPAARTRLKYMQQQGESQAENVARALSEVQGSFIAKVGGFQKTKRQVGLAALGGMVVGGIISSLFNQFSSQSLTNILNDKVNIIVTKVEHNSVQISQNQEDIKRLNQTMEFVHQELGKQILINKVLDLEFMIQLVINTLNEEENRVEHLLEALDQVFVGKFHRGLTTTGKLQIAMNSLRDQAINKGLLIGVQSLTELYQLPTSFVYNPSSNTVHVILHVPLYREAHILSLYRYISSPLQLPWDPELYFELKPDKQFLARNRDGTLTKTLTYLELQDCLSIGHAYFCDDNALEKRALPSCLTALFSGINEALLSECSGHITPKVTTLQRLNKTSYMVAESNPLRLITECFDRGAVRTFTSTIPAGTHFLTVDEECTTTSDHWVISPSNTIEDIIVHAVQVPTIIDPRNFISEIDEETLNMIGNTLKQIGQPIPISHVKGLAAFSAAVAAKDRQYNLLQSLALPSLTSFVILGIGLASFLFYRYCRNQRKTRQQQTVGAGSVNIQLQPLLAAEGMPGESTPAASLENRQPETPPSQPVFRFGSLALNQP